MHKRNAPQETAKAATAPPPVRGVAGLESASTVEGVLALQRAVGNHAVTSMLQRSDLSILRAPPASAATPAAAPDALGPEEEAAIRADVDFIATKLAEDILLPGEEQQIVDRLAHWDDADHRRLVDTGAPGTPHLDRILLLLKVRVFTKSTAFGAIDQHLNAFDELWRTLEDERLSQFSAIASRSRKQAASGPASEPAESFWGTMGKQEAMGGLGAVKGLVMGAAGLVDAGAGGISALGKSAGLDMAEPPKIAEWFGGQYDFMGRQAFGEAWDKDVLFGGKTAGGIGEFGGKAIWQLVMVGAGGQLGAAAKAQQAAGAAFQGAAYAQTALAAIGVFGSLQGVRDAAIGMSQVIERLQKQDKLSAGAVLTDKEFLGHLVSLAASVYGAMSGGAGMGGGAEAANPEQQRWAAARVQALLEAAGAAVHVGTIVEIYFSDASDAEKSAGYNAAIEKLLERIVAAVSGLAGAKDEDIRDRQDAAGQATQEKERAQQRSDRDTAQQKAYDEAVRSATPAAEARAQENAELGGHPGDTVPLEHAMASTEELQAGVVKPSWETAGIELGDGLDPMVIEPTAHAPAELPDKSPRTRTQSAADSTGDMQKQVNKARKSSWKKGGIEAELKGPKTRGTRTVTAEEQAHGIPDPHKWREGSPSSAIRRGAQEALPAGAPDPALPGSVLAKAAQADHIIAANVARQFPDYARLDAARQRQVLNTPENFEPVSQPVNGSRQDTPYADWDGKLNDGRSVDLGWHASMKAKEAAAKLAIEARIQVLLREQLNERFDQRLSRPLADGQEAK